MNTPAAVQPAFLPGIRPDILIVEDDEMVQAFLALHLEHEGYGVRSARNGAEMLSALSEGTPDLIILDLNLPDGDGLSLAQQVRQHSSVPIIVATARKGHDDRLMALGLGADDYPPTRTLKPWPIFPGIGSTRFMTATRRQRSFSIWTQASARPMATKRVRPTTVTSAVPATIPYSCSTSSAMWNGVPSVPATSTAPMTGKAC